MKKLPVFLTFIAAASIITAAYLFFIKKDNSDYFVVVGKAPQFSFKDQDGNTISNKTFENQVYIVDFFFTSCQSICPVMTYNLSQVVDSIPNINIASFSIDPDTDSQRILKDYWIANAKNNQNWHFLRGSSDQVMNLSNTGFNIYAAPTENDFNGGFEHSGLFALINKKGEIVCRKGPDGKPITYYKGTFQDGVQQIIEDAKKLINE